MSLRTGFTLLGTLVALALVVLVRDVLLLLFCGVLLASLMSFPINFMAKRVPRALALVVVLIAGLGFGVGSVYVAYVPISEQVAQLRESLPGGIVKLRNWVKRTQTSIGAVPAGPAVADKGLDSTVKEHTPAVVEKVLTRIVPAALNITEAISALVAIIVLGAFFILEPKTYRGTLLTLLPREHESVFLEAWARLGRVLRSWIAGILVAMSIMGGLTALGLWISGVNDWLLLGFITFLGTFVPYVGAVVSAVPGLFLALSQSNECFYYALAVYLVVHVVEGYIVEPMVMRRAVVIHPGTLLFWQLLMTALFGVMGIVVATPMLACVKELLGYFYVERTLGKELKGI